MLYLGDQLAQRRDDAVTLNLETPGPRRVAGGYLDVIAGQKFETVVLRRRSRYQQTVAANVVALTYGPSRS
ncbi:MAG TPA: hypothetical protein QGH28_07555 [Chloroflexota bacterium]|nr:hypothetical protein [Chloroflexota bacterium]